MVLVVWLALKSIRGNSLHALQVTRQASSKTKPKTRLVAHERDIRDLRIVENSWWHFHDCFDPLYSQPLVRSHCLFTECSSAFLTYVWDRWRCQEPLSFHGPWLDSHADTCQRNLSFAANERTDTRHHHAAQSLHGQQRGPLCGEE